LSPSPIPRQTPSSQIASALEDASLPALVPLTGDEGLIEDLAPREPGRDVMSVGISEDEERRSRALALDKLEALRDGRLPSAAV